MARNDAPFLARFGISLYAPMSRDSAISSANHLLYVGNDAELSKASSGLLRSAGYKVRSTGPLHIQEALHSGRYKAVILCATLTAEEVDLIVRVVQREQPETPLVSVHVGMLGELPHPASSVVVDALQGPSAFLGAIKSVALARPKAP